MSHLRKRIPIFINSGILNLWLNFTDDNCKCLKLGYKNQNKKQKFSPFPCEFKDIFFRNADKLISNFDLVK